MPDLRSNVRSEVMSDPRLTTSGPAVSARDADVQCRGIGPSLTPEGGPSTGEPGRGRGRGAWPSGPADGPTDVPVARPVVRNADGQAVRYAVTEAATAAVSRDAADRAAVEWRRPATGDRAPPAEPSADLARLLDHLRTTVVRYVSDRRRAGVPVQRVLPEVKGLVREAVAYEGWYDPAETLMQQVVGWTIAAYYGEPEPSLNAREGVHVAGRR